MILITGQGRQPEVWGRSQHGHARRVSRRPGRNKKRRRTAVPLYEKDPTYAK